MARVPQKVFDLGGHLCMRHHFKLLTTSEPKNFAVSKVMELLEEPEGRRACCHAVFRGTVCLLSATPGGPRLAQKRRFLECDLEWEHV